MSAPAPEPQPLRGRLAIYYPPGRMTLAQNPFGKDVANLQLWRALARHGGFERIDVFSQQPTTDELLAQDLLDGRPNGARLVAGGWLSQAVAAEAGLLMRGTPDLESFAWSRRRVVGDRAYSLVGLVHTIAPPAMRQMLAMSAVEPMHPWDALICTSPAVRDNLERMFTGWGEHLAERTGGRPPPHPQLPIIPLGVDAEALAAQADRPDARARIRAELALGDDDILVLWVGRLSYFEKAFPQPMFSAVQKAHEATGARIAFVMAGWFPDAADRGRYEEAASAHAPGVAVRFMDGNEREKLGELWAGADIFLSLVDNIQETFGITPLEAMASGRPVVASDWDGYRFTMRDGIEGFLVPTLAGPSGGGLGWALLERHLLGALTYQGYVGSVAQHTAVNIGRAAQAIADLVRSPDLRRRMGQAGRARVREAFDWPVVARQIHALGDELAAVRAASPEPPGGRRGDPTRGDPFVDFAHFATLGFTLDTALFPTPGVTEADILRAGGVALDVAFPAFRAPPELCAQAFAYLQAHPGAPVRQVLMAFATPQRRALELGLAWMAKHGFVDWLT